MGHFEPAIIHPETAAGTSTTSGTQYIDLPEKGWLSDLMVEVAAVCQFSTNPGLDIWNIITKLEVLVNGSQVVKSLTGKQARALWHYWGQDMSALGWYGRHDTSGEKTWWSFPLLFGRYPCDPLYMLNLEAYSNPQLRITWDASPTSVEGETYNASSSPYFRYGVLGHRMLGTPTKAIGHIQSTNIDTWTCVAATPRQVEVPRDNRLIGLMQDARYSDDKMLDYFDNIELNFDNGQWKPIDCGYHELHSLNELWFPREVQMRVRKDNCNAKPLDLCVGLCNKFGGWASNEIVANIYLAHEGTWNIQDLVMYTTGAAAQSTAVAVEFYIGGRFPHQAMYIPVHRFSEEEEFGIDTTKYGRIDLRTTTGTGASTSAIMRTVAEYLVPPGE